MYRRWQEVFQVERIYEEVREEVREMHEYLQARQIRKLERRITALSVSIAFPALIFSFLSINIYGFTAKEEGLPVVVALVLGGCSVLSGLFLWLWVNRRRAGTGASLESRGFPLLVLPRAQG